MSSPISSLKKNKRSPLHSPSKATGDKIAPFRHPDFSDDQLQILTENTPTVRFLKGLKPFRRSDDALNLLDSLTVNKTAGRPASSRSRPSSLTSNSQELTCLLMSRLVQVETKLSEAQKLLFEKDEKIAFLEEKLKIFEKTKDLTNSNQCTMDLQEKCLKFQQQIQEMEKFLNDYGMVWVGEKRTSSVSVSITDTSVSDIAEERVKIEPMWKPESSVVQTANREFRIDYDLVKENIKELNMIAGEGVSQVDLTPSGGQLKAVVPIPLTLYANGLMMFNGPFRSFSDSTTQQYVQDLMDGYYPSELQAIYPEGVPFVLNDKRNVIFKPSPQPFEGEGNSLLGKKKSGLSLDCQSIEEIRLGFQVSEEFAGRKAARKIPPIVIKDGSIVLTNNLTRAKETKFTNCKTNQVIVPGIETLKKTTNAGEVVTLRMKSETGSESYLIKLSKSNTIGDLRKCLNDFRVNHSNPYRILSLYPYRVYDDASATLRECDITSNRVLFLQANK